MFINTIVTSLPRDCRACIYIDGKKVFAGVVAAVPNWVKSYCKKMNDKERARFGLLRVNEYVDNIDNTAQLYVQRQEC